MKVLLNCKYGNKLSGSTVDLDKDVAKTLITRGLGSEVAVVAKVKKPKQEKKKD